MPTELLPNSVGRCVHGGTPICTQVCPFGLDLRDLTAKLSRGSFDAALRVLRSAVLFPEVVGALCERPCETACIRSDLDEAINVGGLERACRMLARRSAPVEYNIPPKSQTVGIVGAGLLGLSAALRLAQRKYRVIVFEQSDRIGGRLWDQLASEQFLPEMEKAFSCEEVDWRMNSAVTSLSELPACDALLVATGSSGARFGFSDGWAGEVSNGRGGVFVPPSPDDGSAVAAIAAGIAVAADLECYIKTGKSGEGITQPVPLPPDCVETDRVVRAMRVTPENGVDYNRQEARDEADRCLRCDCTRCFDRCSLMQHYNQFPLRILEDVGATLNPLEGESGRVAMRLLASCSQCGLCADKCPYGADVGALLLDARCRLHGEGNFPPPFHDFWLRDMAFSNTEASLLLLPNGQETCETLFFPGCQLGASDPRYVSGSYALLQQSGAVGLLLGCCGIPAEWAGNTEMVEQNTARLRETLARIGNPRVVFACPTCRKTFARLLPEVTGVSLYEMLVKADTPVPPLPPNTVAAVFDPCSSRDFDAEQQAVRTLVLRAGVDLRELPTAGSEAVCCGWGGHIDPADRAYASKVTHVRAEESPYPYVAYCANCRDYLADDGKDCRHVLDVVLGLSDGTRAAPTQTERRENRLHLRRMLEEEAFGKTSVAEKTPTVQLHISPALAKQMSDHLILEEEIVAVVTHGERTGEKLLDPERNACIGHLQQGIITYWAVWRSDGDGFELLDAYSHRMKIEEA